MEQKTCAMALISAIEVTVQSHIPTFIRVTTLIKVNNHGDYLGDMTLHVYNFAKLSRNIKYDRIQ